LNAFFDGYLFGLALVVLIGPVFFTLLKSALQHGFKAGFLVALGIFAGDVLCVGLGLGILGGRKFFENPQTLFYLGLAAGLLIIGLGLRYVFRPSLDTGEDLSFKTSDYLSYFVKGFLVNFVNPFVFGVWFSYITIAENRFPDHSWLWLGGALLGILTTDTLKAIFAHRLKIFLRKDLLKKIYRLIGIILILIGLGILVRVIFWPIG
jgi:threonine/homoserine/homoserine lactone efflux protein